MKSYRDGDLSPEQINKLAAEIPDSEIEASLKESEDHRPFILEREPDMPVVGFWCAFWGPTTLRYRDPVRRHAVLNYLRQHGYPSFQSSEDATVHAKAHDWPRKPHPKTGKFEFDW